MKSAVIIHGRPDKEDYYGSSRSPSNNHWLPWLQRELIVRDILAQTPEMPRPYEYDYGAWKQIFEQYVVDDETILVGHSCGGGFLVRWLTENKVKVGRVVLVAPSLGYGWEDRSMFEFEIDSDLATRAGGITAIVAKDEREAIKQAVHDITSRVKNVKLVELETGAHFTYKNMHTDEFPALLEEVLA